ncbi:concanavalin A-like lectin/glucanase [Trichoderma novae-zelandiae]
MTIRVLVNAALLAIPIAVTLGILFGLQAHRTATGQPPLFAPEPPPIPTPKPKVPHNGITKTRYCQKSIGITPDTKGQQYTLNPNQWNWNSGDPGALCMNVTTFNNGTYATATTAPEFMVSWQYPPGPADNPVHAFPNIQVDTDVFPATINTISKVDIDLEWSYGIGNETTTGATLAELTADNLNTNVALDMFIDSEKKASQDPTKAKYELMVWFASIGPATQPIGFAQGPVTQQTLDGNKFELYAGVNQQEQNVLTWYTDTPVEKFNGDISPLINSLFKITATAADLPKSGDYLGYMALGSEAFSADKTVTLYVPKLSIDIETDTSSTT